MACMSYKNDEIQEFIEEEKRLPSTHRRGDHSSRDDVGEGLDGQPTNVPRLRRLTIGTAEPSRGQYQ